MDNYRIFISYSRKDQELFNNLVAYLEKELNIQILSDRNIKAGSAFSDEIKGLIIHAHIFLPLLTVNSSNSSWVHQEIGYAIARNIPVLPIAVENAGLPAQMIAKLQAISVKDDLTNISEKLCINDIERLIFPSPLPQEMIQIAKWPEDRAKLITEYANRIIQMGKYGTVRQQGAYSSFCLPDNDITDKIWIDRENINNVRSDYYHYLQREERKSLERHARDKGCRLIIIPNFIHKSWSPNVRPYRLKTLLDFLENMPENKCEVITSNRAKGGNLLIVGDWFTSESLTPKGGGYLQTVFNWHAPNARRIAKQFDDDFKYLCELKGLTTKEAFEQTKKEIREIIKNDIKENSKTKN